MRLLIIKLLRFFHLNKIIAKQYYQYLHGFSSATKELPAATEKCLKEAVKSGIAGKGDYCEFGVFKGYSFLHAQQTAEKLGITNMRFFGFDSFEGLPAPEGIDATEEEHFYSGQYSWPYKKVYRSLDENGVDWKKTFLTKGFFSDSLNEKTRSNLGLEKVSVALIDADLYSSSMDALNFLKNLIRDKTILIMDDWNGFDGDDSRGQRRALAEFLENNPAWSADPWFNYGYYGQVFKMRLDKKHT